MSKAPISVHLSYRWYLSIILMQRVNRFTCETLIAFAMGGHVKITFSPPGDMVQQQSALTGVIAAVQWAFMKPYFFLITPHTQPPASPSVQIRVQPWQGPSGGTAPCSGDHNKIYHFCPEILASLHPGRAEGKFEQCNFPALYRNKFSHSSDINLFNSCIIHKSFEREKQAKVGSIVCCSNGVFVPNSGKKKKSISQNTEKKACSDSHIAW